MNGVVETSLFFVENFYPVKLVDDYQIASDINMYIFEPPSPHFLPYSTIHADWMGCSEIE